MISGKASISFIPKRLCLHSWLLCRQRLLTEIPRFHSRLFHNDWWTPAARCLLFPSYIRLIILHSPLLFAMSDTSQSASYNSASIVNITPVNDQRRVAALKDLGATFEEGTRKICKIATPVSSDDIPSFMDADRVEVPLFFFFLLFWTWLTIITGTPSRKLVVQRHGRS